MFGLEFAVSAGRCTRGIYAQLIPVSPDSHLPFDYMIVLDSEGLRAPELANDKYQHDNELATFVIGLADLTLVNLKGENTAEMRDVLQIVIHAFLEIGRQHKMTAVCFCSSKCPCMKCKGKNGIWTQEASRKSRSNDKRGSPG